MVRKSIDQLEGGEVLAKHIVTESGFELMASGTVVRRDYIKRLKELNYEYVFIKEQGIDIDFEQPDYIVKKEVREKSIKDVKNVLERHIYKNSTDIEKLCQVADTIMNEVLNEKDVNEELTNIRKEGYDLYTHSINVCSLATVMGLKCGLSDKRIGQLAKGCLLHDIGLRYTTVEYEKISEESMALNDLKSYRKHVINGYEGIEEVKWLSETAKRIVLLHHERCDGSGYPFKNKDEDLEQEIKIASICETFDSMITGIGSEVYKIYEVIEYIKVHSIDYFDPEFVKILMHMVAMYPIGTKVITNEGEMGIVIGQNKETPERPIIKIITNESGNKIKFEKVIDLLESLTIFIVDTME